MSRRIPLQDLNYKFEKTWGGEDTWYTKCRLWANKQDYPLNEITHGILRWVKNIWIEGKIILESASITMQSEELKNQWENDEPKPTITETGEFGEDGWSISIQDPWKDEDYIP